MTIFETVFLVLVMIFFAFSMRVVGENQRIGLFRLGRYAGLKGPGMVFVVPYMDRECKVTIGDRGTMMEDKTGQFMEFRLPVDARRDIGAGSSITVVGFTKETIQVI